MIVHAIFQTSVALTVRARLAFQNDRPAIGHDQPVPNQQHAALPKPDAIVIFTDDAATLRQEQDAAGRAVIDVFRDLRGDLAGMVGANTGDERGSDYRSCLKDLGRCRGRDAIRRHGAPIDWGIDECQLAILSRLWAALTSGSHACEPRSGAAWHNAGSGFGLEEHPAGAGGFLFREAALLLLIYSWSASHCRWNDGLPPVPGVEYRTAKIAGKGWAENRAGVVTWQAR